jgi:hypothetical protein
MANLFLKVSKNPVCWIRQPFFFFVARLGKFAKKQKPLLHGEEFQTLG